MVAAEPEQWVRLLGTVLELRGPHAVVVWAGTAAGEARLLPVLDAAWRVRLSQTGPVLDALASTSADKAVAKAARKAAYKLRSAPLTDCGSLSGVQPGEHADNSDRA